MDDNELTAEEQTALDAQRQGSAASAEPAPEAPQDGATGADTVEDGQLPADTEKRPQMVPHAALHEERERRKEAERRAAEIERRSEERFRALMEKLGPQPQPEQPPAIPPVDQDPVGHIVGSIGQMREQVQTLTQSQAAQQEAAQRAQALQAMQQHALALEAEYRRDNPDYEPAVTYVANLRHQQLMAGGVTNPAERQAIINQEAMGIAYRAMQQGQNPAEMLYNIAKASGFSAQQAQQASGQQAQQPNPAQRLDTIARGQQQARDIGNVRGSGPSPITAQKMQEMSNDDFLEMMKKPPAEVRRLMGL